MHKPTTDLPLSEMGCWLVCLTDMEGGSGWIGKARGIIFDRRMDPAKSYYSQHVKREIGWESNVYRAYTADVI